MRKITYTLHIGPHEYRGYVAHFPALAGSTFEGRSVEEIVANAKDVLINHLTLLQAQGETIPEEKYLSETGRLPITISFDKKTRRFE